MDLTLTTREEGDRTVVVVGGEIDVYTAPKLREQLVDLVNAGRYHLVIDMEAVDFLDSTGLGVLVGGLKRVRAHDGSRRDVREEASYERGGAARPANAVRGQAVGR